MTERPLRVVIADDHASMRAGVRLALEGSAFEVVAEASDTPSAIAAALEHRPDVCLLDVHMPGEGGIAACGTITAALPETKVVILSVSRNDADLFHAITAGASGYLLKGIEPSNLAAALRGVAAGEAAFPRKVMAKVIAELRDRSRHGPAALVRQEHQLTSREWEVLDLLADGLRTAQIAQRLYISATTVRRHVSSILHKLDVPDRQAAVEVVRRRSPNVHEI